MIQRIQTVYLILVFVFALLFLFYPLGSFQFGSELFKVKLWGLIPEGDHPLTNHSGILGKVVMALVFVIMILCVYTTLNFRKRLYQIKMGKLNILIHILLVVMTFLYIDSLKNGIEDLFSYGVAIIFPLFSLVLILMANRAIRSDENKVRAADRLR